MPIAIAKTALGTDANLVNSYPLNGNVNDAKGAANGTQTGVVFNTTASPFNDGSKGADLTANAGAGTGAASAFINALFFAPGASDFTYIAWVKFVTVANGMSVLHNEANGATGRPDIDLGIDGAGNFTAIAQATSALLVSLTSSGITVTAGVWYLLALVRSGNNWNIYVNGVSVASGSSAGTTIASSNGAIGFRYNTTFLGTQLPVNGYMADAAMFSRALTTTEMLNLVNSNTVSNTLFGPTFTVLNASSLFKSLAVAIFNAATFTVLQATPNATAALWNATAKAVGNWTGTNKTP